MLREPRRTPSRGSLAFTGEGGPGSLRPDRESETIVCTYEFRTDAPLDVRLSLDATAYEMRQRGDVVARLEWLEPKQVSMRGVAVSGSWRFVIGKDGRSWMGTAEDEASGRAIAGYYPHWRARRAIAFDDDEWYRLRAPVLGATWKLSAPRRTPVARLRTGDMRGFVERVERVELAEGVTGVTALPLLVMFAVWAVLVEPMTFPVGDTGSGG